MKAFRLSGVLVALVAMALFAVAGLTGHAYAAAGDPQATPGMSLVAQLGLTAAGDRAGANEMQAATTPSYVDLGLTAAGDRLGALEMQVAAASADQTGGTPVQWHDIFTGVGVTLAVLVLMAFGSVAITRRRHAHGGRFTPAH